MNVAECLDALPDAKGCVIVLSGGMDSTIAMRLAVQKYGAPCVSALTFDYGQKQVHEVHMAARSSARLAVNHKIIHAKFLGDISKGFSANCDPDIAMPTIQEVLGDPTPKTYVPNRNMILLSIAAAYAETRDVEYIITGLQATDEYGYWDTTARFAAKMNDVFAENRKTKIKLIAPFVTLSKHEEIRLLIELDGHTGLLANTLTCYNPITCPTTLLPLSCGNCPSCAERINAFMRNNQVDPVKYVKSPWS